jgi:hypothetical protein
LVLLLFIFFRNFLNIKIFGDSLKGKSTFKEIN